MERPTWAISGGTWLEGTERKSGREKSKQTLEVSNASKGLWQKRDHHRGEGPKKGRKVRDPLSKTGLLELKGRGKKKNRMGRKDRSTPPYRQLEGRLEMKEKFGGCHRAIQTERLACLGGGVFLERDSEKGERGKKRKTKNPGTPTKQSKKHLGKGGNGGSIKG